MSLMEVMPVAADNLERLLFDKMKVLSLPDSYQQQLRDWYVPLSIELIESIDARRVSRPLVIGLQGSQGSGKSTLSAFIKLIIENTSRYKVAIMSLDDFYLSKDKRAEMAKSVHALFRTRGVPGTHDVERLNHILDAFILRQACVKMPRFLKYKDDVGGAELVSGNVDLVLFEGWCVGLPPEPAEQLIAPLNDLEQMDDSMATWRRYVNHRLESDYAALFARLDKLIYMQAPGFDCVYEWRHLQEDMMLKNLYKLDEREARQVKAMSPQQLRRFIYHYERLTRHAFNVMPKRAQWVIELNAQHYVQEIKKA